MFCRTVDDVVQAGRADAALDPPLTERQITQLVALLGPHLRPGSRLGHAVNETHASPSNPVGFQRAEVAS